MSKDWRHSVCTRHRPLITVLAIIAFLSIGFFLIPAIELSSDASHIKKANQLKLGMTEEDLITLMGKPSHKLIIRPGYEGGLLPGQKDIVKDAVDKHGQVVEYVFGKRKFGWIGVSMIYGVFLDKEGGNIVALKIQDIWWDLIPAGYYEGAALLAFWIAFPWISIRLWCKWVAKRWGSQQSR